jgi:hypothetical protein
MLRIGQSLKERLIFTSRSILRQAPEENQNAIPTGLYSN